MYKDKNCNQLSENNDTLKRELSDFIDLLREKVSDAAFDKNFIILKNELLAFEDRVYTTGSTVGRNSTIS